MAKKDYGTDTNKGKGFAGCEDSRLSAKRPWDVPNGLPEPPGETKKIPRPE